MKQQVLSKVFDLNDELNKMSETVQQRDDFYYKNIMFRDLAILLLATETDYKPKPKKEE